MFFNANKDKQNSVVVVFAIKEAGSNWEEAGRRLGEAGTGWEVLKKMIRGAGIPVR